MGPVLSAIFSFIGGPIIKAALEAYTLRLKAINSQDAMATDLLKKEIDADIAARAEATKILIAEQGHWLTRSVRPVIGWIVIILLAKILVYDKALGDWTHGHTDPLDANLWNVVSAVIYSYFGSTAVERVTRIFRR